MKLYNFNVNNIMGDEISLGDYKDKVLLIVNTASKCGFTPQYEELQKLYDNLSEKDFEILGFPCNQFLEQEPEGNSEIASFCSLNYGVTFDMFEKIDVNGENADPLFVYLKEQAPAEAFDLSNEGAKGLHGFLTENFPALLTDNQISWNFTKFLVDGNGNVIKRYPSYVSPLEIQSDIEKLL